MSLLEGRHIVELVLYDDIEDEWGTHKRVKIGKRRVKCTVQWNQTGEVAGLAVQPATDVTVIAREWKGKAQDHFMWDGYEFEQIGPPRTFNGSRRVKHVEVHGRLVATKK